MITGITLKNFKAFKTIDNLAIKPLTILSGVNSSGKSSILHSLLLLKQTLEEKRGYGSLLLDGQYLQYSHIRELTYGLPRSKSALFSIQLALTSDDGKEQRVRMDFRQKEIPSIPNEHGPVLSRFEWQTGDDNTSGTIRFVKGVYRSSNVRFPSLPKGYSVEGQASINFDRFLPQYVVQEAVSTNKKKEEKTGGMFFRAPISVVSGSLAKLILNLRDDLHNIRYLGPIRAKPQRAYVYYTSNYELDDDGGNVAQVYWLRRNESVIWRGKTKTLGEAVEEAIVLLGMHQKIIPKQSINIVYQLEASTTVNSNKKVSIADVGFGYSQSLPIILRGLLAPSKSLVLFDQPEIHLHPSSKANLADLFLEFVNSGSHVIVETHSPELIDRLRLRVIENPNIADSINIIFVEPEEPYKKEGAKIRQLEMNKDGMLDIWPDGFCDESQKLAREIIIARANRGK